MLDKKGDNILLLDMREEALFTDFFLICDGENDRQLKALVELITLETQFVWDENNPTFRVSTKLRTIDPLVDLEHDGLAHPAEAAHRDRDATQIGQRRGLDDS